LDVLNIVHGLTFAEKIIEDESAHEFSNIYRLYFNKDVNILNLVEDYNNDSNVEFAEPNYIYHLNSEIKSYNYIKKQQENGFIPNDPYFNMQWALHNTGQNNGTFDADIDAPEAWETTIGDNDVVVAVVDSGVDYTNPDLGNCTQGITEIVLDEPIVGGDIFDFGEIFSNYDFDSISLHFNYIDVGSGRLWLDSYKNDDFDDTAKTIFDLYDYRYGCSVLSNIWTIFSEKGAKKVEMYYRIDPGYTGFEIDKVRLLKWEKLSIRCPEKYVDGYDFIYNDPDPMDDNGHGTHCAWIISAVIDNGIGIAGTASNCKIMPVRIFDKDGNTNLIPITKGIYYAAKHGADIISLSMGGGESKLIKFIINYAYNRGVVIVASAGNDGFNFKYMSAPGCYENAIAVAATDRNDNKTWWSNYGPWVDIAALGHDILSTRAYATDMYLGEEGYPPGYYFVPQYDNDAILYRASGTSMSCSYVAGIAALILSENPNLTPQEVKTIIRSSSDPITSDKYVGTGRINAYKAVQKTAPVTVEIDDTMDNKNIKGLYSIYGTAKGEMFERYEFQYSTKLHPNENEWVTISGSISTTPKDNKKLFVFDTTTLRDGLYTIRLLVVAGNHTYEDRTIVIIDNYAQTIYVDSNAPNGGDGSQGAPFNKIQKAVDACGTKDTIYVYGGTYNEQIKIEEKTVTIKGQNKDNTIIDSNGKEYGTIQIFSGCIHISDITLKSWQISEDLIYFCIEGYNSKDSSITNSRFLSTNDLGSIGLLSLGSYRDNSDNTITGNSLDIIYIFLGKQNIISNNILKTLIIEYSNKNYIFSNTVSHGKGMSIQGSSNIIYSNNIENDNENGIILVGAKNLIYDNTISNNNNGILLYISNKNIITNNKIKNNNYGIYLDYDALLRRYCKDNKIYHNNFIENTHNAYDSSSEDCNNKWYSTLIHEGNYWSDYTEDDANGDGIGDTPYNILGGNNKDLYPLIKPCSGSSQQSSPSPESQPSSQTNSQQYSAIQQTITGSTITIK
jgi:parallel beta-helix repeat protein